MKRILNSERVPLTGVRGSVSLQNRDREGAVWVAALALLVAAPAANAQRADLPSIITNVAVSAPRNYVLAARTMQLGARAVNSRGAIMRGRSFQWQVSDATRAVVDANGMLLGLAPGAVDVTVTDGDSGATGVRTFYVYPGGIAISAGAQTVQTGDTVTLAAQVQDADGKTIPNVPVQWFSSLPAVARVSADGVLTGVAEGRVTVTAALDMGPTLARFTAFANIEVLRRAGFRLKTLISSDVTAAGAATLVPSHVSAAGNFVSGITSLSNGGQALLLSQNGRLRTLAVTGSMINGHVVTRMDSAAVNSRGDVVAFLNTQAEWCEQMLVLFSAASQWAPAVLDDTQRCGYWGITPGAIGKQGEIVYRYGNALFYRKPDGTRQTILTVGDHPAGINTVSNISNWGVSPFGKVLIETQNPANNSVYFAWDGTALRKLFATGDQVGSEPSQWARLPMEISPGEYITRIGGNNWASLSRYKDGTWSTIAHNGQNNLGWVQDGYDGADGYIFFYADRNGRTSLMRTNGSSLDVLGTYANWREISQVMAAGGDAAIAYGTMDGPVPKAVRFSGTSSSVVLGPGQAVDGTPAAGLLQASIPKGINASGVLLRTSGDALLRVNAGGVTTVLKPGDALPVGNLAALGGVAANRMGELAFTAQHGPKFALYTYRNGQVQMIADTDDQLGSNNGQVFGWTNGDNQVAMNNAGQIAAVTGTSSGGGLFVYSGSASSARNVMRFGGLAPGGGGSFGSVNQVAIDENGRVAFVSCLSNGKCGVFVWDQGNIQEIIESGKIDPTGRVYQGFNNLQAGGTRFYLRASSSGLNEYLMIDGTTVKVLATDGYAATFGAVISNAFGPEVAANSRGDVVFPVVTPSGAALFVKQADGTDALVAIGSQKGPDNEWFLSIFGSGIGEQGDIVFSALGWVDGHPRFALYLATHL
jgi:hypothetical protein